MLRGDLAAMYRFWPAGAAVEDCFRGALCRPLLQRLAELPLFLLPGGQLVKMGGGVFRPRGARESLRPLFRAMFPVRSPAAPAHALPHPHIFVPRPPASPAASRSRIEGIRVHRRRTYSVPLAD